MINNMNLVINKNHKRNKEKYN